MTEENIKKCIKVWQLHQFGENNTAIAKSIGCNRMDIISILKYTHPSMFQNDITVANEIEKQKILLNKLTEKNAKLSYEKLNFEEKYKHYHDKYFSLIPYKKYLLIALSFTLFVGFFAGGFLEKTIMNNHGFFLTVDQLFIQKSN